MKINPQVAIMMPVYNGEKTLHLAISSLLHQTYPYWKCYIVNDGSTDGTKAYLDALEDERLVVIHFEKNIGRPYARQAALDAAEGKYLAFLDADDFYHPDKLKLQVEAFLLDQEVCLVGCGMASFNRQFKLKTVRSNYKSKLLEYKIGKETFKPARAPSMVFLDKAKLIGYNLSLKYGQDTDFFMRYLDGHSYVNIKDVLYYYSEFCSVTKRKILFTNFYGIIFYKNHFSKAPIFFFKKIVVNLIKIVLKILTYPFWNAEDLINKRGIKVSSEIEKEFSTNYILFSCKK